MGWARRLNNAIGLLGVDPVLASRNVRGLPTFLRNKQEFEAQYAVSQKEFPLGNLYPCLADRYNTGGVANTDYFHQDLHMAQLIFKNRPARHVDVGSRVDGFVAHVASFMSVEVLDIRPTRSSARGLTFKVQDMMQMPFPLRDYCDSLSCLHTLEHFGLGRFGDPVNYDGWRQGWQNLVAMLRTGGKLYFSVPTGEQRVQFDGGRVFSVPFLMEKMIRPAGLQVDSFAYVDNEGEIHFDVDPEGPGSANSFGNYTGPGLFELTKL